MAENEALKFDGSKSEPDPELRRAWLESVRATATQDVEKFLTEFGNSELTGPGRTRRTEAMSMVGRFLFASANDSQLDEAYRMREAMLEGMAEECFASVAEEWKKQGLVPDEESRQTYIQAFVRRFGLGNPPVEA